MNDISLIPFSKIKLAMSALGMTIPSNKAQAVIDIEAAIGNGLITRDHFIHLTHEVKLTPLPVLERVDPSSDLIKEVNQRTNAVALEVESLRSQVELIKGVDQDKVTKEIRQTVSALFESFKQSDQFSTLAPAVAQAFPKTRPALAEDLFDGNLFYMDEEGHIVDFSKFECEVWDDPAAPAVMKDYIFDPAALHQTLIALSTTLPHNTWLGGERGTGKTEFVTQIAARLGRRLFRINFDEGLERSEFIGSNTIENGNVVWKAGTLTQAIRHAGAIILLDEVGFARAQNISPLHAVTERSVHRALVIAETGERIPVAPHVVFFAADNSVGHGDESGNFAGVREQNSAFLDRFSFTIRFEYLSASDEVGLITKRTGLPEQAAALLVKFANVARNKAKMGALTQPPSLRQLFAWAAAVQSGMPVGMAFNNAIVNKFPSDCEAELRGIYSAVVDSAQLKSYLARA